MPRGRSTAGETHSIASTPVPGSVSSGAASLNGLTNNVEHLSVSDASPMLPHPPQSLEKDSINPASGALQAMQVGEGRSGMKLKKGTLWGQSETGRPTPPPTFGVVGCSCNGDGTSSPRPPSSVRGVSRGGTARSGETSPSPPSTSHGRDKLAHGSVPLGAPTQPTVNKLELSFDSPLMSSRKLTAATPGRATGPYGGPASLPSTDRSAQHLNGDATPAQREAMAAARAMLDGPAGGAGGPSQVMRIEQGRDGSSATSFPSAAAAPPEGVSAGGADEIRWLREQLAAGERLYSQLEGNLQRVQQESHAIRSSLMAQQRNRHTSGGAGIEYEVGPKDSSPQMRRGSGSLNNLLPGGKAAGGTTKKRDQRKRAPLLSREGAAGGGGGESFDETIVHVHPKSDELADRILKTLSCKAPFEGHDEADLSQLVAAMAPVEFKEGVDVLSEGDAGDLAYWVEDGTLAVVVGGVEVDTIGKDTVFGEVALIYDLNRTATIRTKSACSMWLLHRAMFQHILRDNAIADRKKRFAFLKTVSMFASLSHRELSRVADVVEEVTFEVEEVVISEGEMADAMYVIQEGQAVVSQRLEPSSAGGDGSSDGKSLLRFLKAGDYFGEKALLTEGILRTATVTSASKIQCLKIDKACFVELLGGLRQELIRRAPTDVRRGGVPTTGAAVSANGSTPAVSSSGGSGGSVSSTPNPSPLGSRSSASPHSSRLSVDVSAQNGMPGGALARQFAARKLQPSPESLSTLKNLGSGGYGRVVLVRDSKTRRIYALKRVCREHLLAHNGAMRCEWLVREKRVLETLEHPFVCRLHGTYADDSSIYLLLSAAMGGDLYRLIEKLGQVPEKVARFYISSVVLALAHIHSHEIIYRDLKPENVLLDVRGFVKLCDFGFAKQVSDRTYTRCGTPDYTAPEMLLNQGVNQACDWWALGILIFEMVVGMPPFTDPAGDDMKTYQNITAGQLLQCYPDDAKVSEEARELIQGLCTVKVAYRLGYLKGGANDVQEHTWFAGYDWNGLVNMTVDPPWRPNLKSFDDTTCFDDQADGNSLDGPSGRSHPEDLLSKWRDLRTEYTGSANAVDDMSHLTGVPPL